MIHPKVREGENAMNLATYRLVPPWIPITTVYLSFIYFEFFLHAQLLIYDYT